MDMHAVYTARTIEVGECIEWQGRMLKSQAAQPNTPVAQTTAKGKSVHIIVARWVWEQEHGPIPPGTMIYRTCCNNRCVRGKHLAAGTLADVKAARRAAGQTRHKPSTKAAIQTGARKRPSTINTVEQARLVRDLVAAGKQDIEIAAETGVRPSTVKDIRLGRGWRECAPGSSVFNFKGVF